MRSRLVAVVGTLLIAVAAWQSRTPVTAEERIQPDTVEREAKPGQLPTIKEIMQESHKCRTSYVNLIRDELARETEIQWPEVVEKSRSLIHAGKMLALNDPPRGARSSWEKRTTLYVANAVLMHDAAERHSVEDVNYHLKKLRLMCVRCHGEHR